MNKLTWLSLLFVLTAVSAFAANETTHLRIDSYSQKTHSQNYNKHTYDITGITPAPAHAFDMTNLYAVKVDKPYPVVVSLLGPGSYYDTADHTVSLLFNVPDGYTVLLGSYEAAVYNAVDDVDYFTFTIVKTTTLGASQSTLPTVSGDQLRMDLGVGRLANGQVLSPIRLRADLGSNVDEVVKLQSIRYSRPYGNIWVVEQQSGGILTAMQIKKPDVIISITKPTTDKLQIAYYKRSEMTGTLNSSSSWMTPVTGAEPFSVFVFSKQSETVLNIEEKVGSITYESVLSSSASDNWKVVRKGSSGSDQIRNFYFKDTVSSFKSEYRLTQRYTSAGWVTDRLTRTDFQFWSINNVDVRMADMVAEDPPFSTAMGQIPANPNGRNFMTQYKHDNYGRLEWMIDAFGKWQKSDYITDPSNSSYARPFSVTRPFENGMIFEGSGEWSLKPNYSSERRIQEKSIYGASIGSWPARIIGDYPSKRESRYFPGDYLEGLAEFAYSEIQRNGKPVLETTATQYMHPNRSGAARIPVTTKTARYWKLEYGTDTLFVDQLYAVTEPGGRRTAYVHQKGNLSGTNFTPSSSGYTWREVSFTGQATSQSGSSLLALPSGEFSQGGVLPQAETLHLIPHRSEKKINIRNEGGKLVYDASYMWGNDNGTMKWIFAGSTTHTYDAAGRLNSSLSSNGDLYEADYDANGLLEKETFADGRIVEYTYDVLGRMETKTEKGIAGVAEGVDRTTTYSYNAMGKVIRESTTHSGTSEELLTVIEYDKTGNLYRQRNVNNSGMEVVLNKGGVNNQLFVSKTTKYFSDATNSSGVFTSTPAYYREVHENWHYDGSPRRIWGDVAEPQQYKTTFHTTNAHYERSVLYGDHTDITASASWSDSGLEDKKWQRSYYNAIGLLYNRIYPARTVLSGDDDLGYESYGYSTAGLLTTAFKTGEATLHYQYDSMGVPVMEGVDVSWDGILTTDGTDQIKQHIIEYYTNWNGDPTQKVETRTYDDEDQPIILSREETKLDGFGSTERSSVVSISTPHHPNAWAEAGAVVTQNHVYSGSRETLHFSEMWFNSQRTWHEALKGKNGFLTESLTAAMEADQTDPVRYTYDGFGRKVSEQDPRGYLRTFEYYPGTTQVAEVYGEDADGNLQLLTEYEYCGCGGKVSKETIHHGVDSSSNPITSEIMYTYYGNGLLKTQDGNGTTPARYAYNDHGQRTDMWQYPDGTISYNDAVGSRTRWEYWGNGLLHRKLDAQSRKSAHTYNDLGRPYQIVTDRASGEAVTQTFTYQVTGLCLLTNINFTGPSAIINNTPNKIFTYDRLGRMKTVTHTYPASLATEFGISQTQTWTWHYNADTQNTDSIAYGKLSHIQMPAMYGTGSSIRKLEYDYEPGMGFVERRQLKAGTTSEWRQDWSFYDDGRPYEISSDGRVFNLDWEPGTGFMSSVDVQTNNSRTVNRTRQLEEHRPFMEAEETSISGPNTVVSSAFYTRDRQGRIADRHLSGTQFSGYGQYNSHTTFYNYNQQGELTEENAWANGDANPMMDRHRSYGYDRAGNRDSKREVYAGISSNGSNSNNAAHIYSPNNLNQYTGVTRSQQWETITGKYDPTTDLNPGVTTDWVYQQSNNTWWYAYPTDSNSSGQLAWAAPLDIIGSDTQTTWRAYYEDMSNTWSEKYFPPKSRSPAHDYAGNMTDDGYLTYVYDGENRLMQVSDGQLTWKFLYDPFGRRIRQKLSGWYFSYYAQGWTNELLYHSQLVYDEWHPILEQVLGGQSTSHRYKYYWGPDISGSYGGAGGIGGLLMMHRSNISKSYTVGYDGNGNVLNMIDLSDGSVDATFEYDAFGQTVRETGDSWRMPFRHQTKWSTAYAPTSKLMGGSTSTMAAPRIKIDLYDYGLRWYHPNFGRFVNRDPIGEAGGINLYAFVGNDPVYGADMLGMSIIVNNPIIASGNNRASSNMAASDDVVYSLFPHVRSDADYCGHDVRVIPDVQREIVEIELDVYWRTGTADDTCSEYWYTTPRVTVSIYDEIVDQLKGVSRKSPNNLFGSSQGGGGGAGGGGAASGGSTLGNALRKIPYFGGLLGSLGDTVSGAVNTAVGVATFGTSGTLGRGISQFGGGLAAFAEITVKDAYAGVVGLGIGTIVSTATWAVDATRSLARGNFMGFGKNFGSMVVDLAIPEYGWWNGWNWGEPQFGRNGPAAINQIDHGAYDHDVDLNDGLWIKRAQYPITGHTPNGIIGGIYGILGTGPFLILNRNPSP